MVPLLVSISFGTGTKHPSSAPRLITGAEQMARVI